MKECILTFYQYHEQIDNSRWKVLLKVSLAIDLEKA